MNLVHDQKKSEKTFHLESIDFLRGYAALCVMIHHISEGLAFSSKNPAIQSINHVMSYGALGVPLFFVISGFCIHRRKAEQIFKGVDEAVSFKKYWIRRFYRLYPSYLVVCLLSAILLLIAKMAGVSSVTIDTYPGNPYLFLMLDLVTHLLMVHCFFSMFDYGLGNGPLWTLAREEQYYLIYFPLLQIRKRLTIWTCLILSLVASYVVVDMGNSIKSENLHLAKLLVSSSLAYWPQWILGMLSVEMVVGLHRFKKNVYRFKLALPVCLILTVVQTEFGATDAFFRNLILGLLAFLFITSMAKFELEGRWPQNTFTHIGRVLGRYSYSLYLVHYPIVIILSKMARHLGSSQSILIYLLALILTGILCQIPAYMLYKFVEVHGQSQKIKG